MTETLYLALFMASITWGCMILVLGCVCVFLEWRLKGAGVALAIGVWMPIMMACIGRLAWWILDAAFGMAP